MTEQPAEEPNKKKPDLWSAFSSKPLQPGEANVYKPGSFYAPGDLAKTGLTDAQLEALLGPPKAAERPAVELSAERRAHVARFAAEYKEWVANGMTPGQALGLVSMEIQLEAQLNRRHRHDEG